jgi:hypothetical protein
MSQLSFKIIRSRAETLNRCYVKPALIPGQDVVKLWEGVMGVLQFHDKV